MSENKESVRLNAVVKELNVGMSTLVDFLAKKGFTVENKPTAKITGEMHQVLLSAFQSDKKVKDDAKALIKPKVKKEEVNLPPTAKKEEAVVEEEDYDDGILIKTELAPTNSTPKPAPPVKEDAPAPLVEKVEPVVEKPEAVITPVVAAEDETDDKGGLKVLGKINLDDFNTKKKKKAEVPVNPPVKNQPKADKNPEVVKPIAETKKGDKKPVAPKPVEPVVTPPVVVEKPAETTPLADDAVATEPNYETNYEKLSGLKVMGKIQLPVDNPRKPQPVASSDDNANKKKRRRKNFVGGSDNIDIKKVEGTNPPPQNRGGYQGNNNRGPGGNNNNPGAPRTGYQGNNNRGPG